MNIKDLLGEIEKIKVHKQKDKGISLKKPLFLLLLISLIEQGKIRENKILYSSIEDELDFLISSFGGRNSPSMPEQPFNYLASSMIWEVKSPYGVGKIRDDKLSKKILRDPESYGYFNKEVFELLQENEINRALVSEFILNKFWPETVQKDIRYLLGLTDGPVLGQDLGLDLYHRRKRDPQFTFDVLSNYQNRCAVCGFSSVFNKTPFGVDAAHIMWHAHEGPDLTENGLALCKFHHWAFDRGVYTFEPKTLEIIVSDEFEAQDDNSIYLINNLEGRKLNIYQGREPGMEYIKWHYDNVFMN